ncbi:hypothetical protein HMPREF9140_00785 [Prevotella micans F0438]|uniref:Uncharacterized protein n=1 Tax=Prevotella micans F0438 TaxID=883158 RepID=H1Q1J7_9BACT|nr:hypothetical protein [Prevotella micans]EHO71844.1 hypothetical protein HMPREF9140_00785 [Prevotella micans F0438]
MIRQDYILRLIEEFMAALSLFLEKEERERSDEDIRLMYEKYLGDYDTLHNLSWSEILDYASSEWPANECMGRIGMIAEIVYAEATFKVGPMRDMLMEKAYLLLNYIETHGKTFSISRRQKMVELSKAISKDLDV